MCIEMSKCNGARVTIAAKETVKSTVQNHEEREGELACTLRPASTYRCGRWSKFHKDMLRVSRIIQRMIILGV